MEITTHDKNGITVLTVTGRMDALTAPTYMETLSDLISTGMTTAVVDFQKLDYISSAGLRAILATAKSLKGKGGEVCFANITGGVKDVFEMSGFGSIFRIHDSVDAAVAGLG